MARRTFVLPVFVLIAASACPPPQPVVFLPESPPPGEPDQPGEPSEPGEPSRPPPTPVGEAPQKPAREEIDAREPPVSLVISGGSLLWTDIAGGIWSMPADRSSEPRQLSDQRKPGFAFQVFTAGNQVLATSRGDLFRVGGPGGPVTPAKIRGLAETPLAVAADARFIYLTLFRRNEIMRVPAAGGEAQKLAELPQAVLALRGETLYAASFSTGTLVAITTATGASRVIARGLAKPAALAADDTHVFVYCEQAETLVRIDPASGAQTELARGLINSDDVELDGDHVYTRTWGARPGLVRVPKDGSRPSELIAELPTPTDLAFDAGFVYATSRDARRIIRLSRAGLAARR